MEKKKRKIRRKIKVKLIVFQDSYLFNVFFMYLAGSVELKTYYMYIYIRFFVNIYELLHMKNVTKNTLKT